MRQQKRVCLHVERNNFADQIRMNQKLCWGNIQQHICSETDECKTKK